MAGRLLPSYRAADSVPGPGGMSYGAVTKLGSDVQDAELLSSPSMTAEEFLDATWGTGMYQLRVLIFIGLIYLTPLSGVLPVVDIFLSMDPQYPAITAEVVSDSMSLFYIGCSLAFPVLSLLYDRFGRRCMTHFMTVFVMATTVLWIWSASMDSVRLFKFGRFMSGTGYASFILSYTYVMEAYHPRLYALVGTILGFGWAFFSGCAALLCHFVVRDWRVATVSFGLLPLVPVVVLGPSLVCESLPYLLATHQWDSGRLVAKQIAECNSVPMPIDLVWSEESKCGGSGRSGESKGLSTVFSALWKVGDRLVLGCICWMAASTSYWGLSFSAGKISDSPCLNIAYFALVDCLGLLVYPPLAARTSCKNLQLCGFLLATMFFSLSARLEPNTWLMLSATVCARWSINLAFITVYQMTMEAFPQRCRCTVFGICNFTARLCTSFAPYLGRFPTSTSFKILSVACLAASMATGLLPSKNNDSGPSKCESRKERLK